MPCCEHTLRRPVNPRAHTLHNSANLIGALVRTARDHNYFTEMCSGSEAGSYLRLIDFVYHSTLGLRVKKKKDHAQALEI